MAETSGKSKSQVAQDLGISDGSLSRWCQEYGKHGEQAFPGSGHQLPEQEEIRQLKLKACNDSWRVDEISIKIKKAWVYLYRAVDSQGQTLDFLWRLDKG